MHQPCRSPVFIIGVPRAGTTLLRLMLTCHPGIAIPPESGFLVDLMPRYGAFQGDDAALKEFLDDLLVFPKFEHWRLEREDLERYLRDEVRPRKYAELVDGVYARWAAVHQGGKPRWGDKNNFYLKHIDAIARLFPQAVFVHIIRDGRDVACSYRSLANVKGRYAPVLPGKILDGVYEWRLNLGRIRSSFDRIGWNRAFELRYEDLVADPQGVLRRVCEFLGEDYSAHMLEYDRENRDRELEPREFDAWKTRNRSGIDASAIGRWQKELSPREQALATLAGGPMLRRYRYESTRVRDGRALLSYTTHVAGYWARRLRRAVRLALTRAGSSSG